MPGMSLVQEARNLMRCLRNLVLSGASQPPFSLAGNNQQLTYTTNRAGDTDSILHDRSQSSLEYTPIRLLGLIPSQPGAWRLSLE